jgi:hypothetical protein
VETPKVFEEKVYVETPKVFEERFTWKPRKCLRKGLRGNPESGRIEEGLRGNPESGRLEEERFA